MKHFFDDFPGEILTVIFDYVRSCSNISTLCQCELVCKSWMLPAQRSLYSRVELRSAKQVDIIISALTRNSSSCPGRFTRTLEYHGISDADDDQFYRWMPSFVNIFPQVRSIFPLKTDSNFYLTLLAAYNAGKWKDLKYFGTCSEESVDIHSTCALLHRETLDILNVHDGKDVDKVKNLYNKLHLFPGLKQLYLETNQHSLFEAVENITKHVQNLEVLSYGNLMGTNFNALAPYKSIDLSSITPQPNIKTLEMHTIGFENDNYLSYLMKKFPELDSITINPNIIPIIHHEQLFKKIKSSANNHSLAMLSKFMAYVSKRQSYTVKLLYTKLKIGELLNNYWNLCDYKGPRTVGVSYIETSNFGNLESQRVQDNSQAYINMTYNSQQEERITSLNYKVWDASLPHFEMLEKCGTGIDELIFSLDSLKCQNISNGQNREMIQMANGYFFSHILEFCTKLQKLYICKSHIKMFTSNCHSFVNTSITDLTLENVLISRDILSQIPKRLPCLKRLALVDLYSDEEEIEEEKTIFNNVIDIRDSSLRFLYIKNYLLSSACRYNYPCKMLLKVTADEGDLHYKHTPIRRVMDNTGSEKVVPVQLEEDSLACPIDKDEYEEFLEEGDWANIRIICKSVNYLAVSLEKINPLLSCIIMLIDFDTYIQMAGMNREQKLDIIMNSIP